MEIPPSGRGPAFMAVVAEKIGVLPMASMTLLCNEIYIFVLRPGS